MATIIGTPKDDFLPGVLAEENMIVGLERNDKLIGGVFDDMLYGDFKTESPGNLDTPYFQLPLTISDSYQVYNSKGFFGDDRLIGKTGDDLLVGDIENAVIMFEVTATYNRVKIKFGDDRLYGGFDNDSLWGDAQIADVGINGSHNKAKIKYGDDYLSAKAGSGQQNAFGDAGSAVTNLLSNATNNAVKHIMGYDKIFVATAIGQPEIVGDADEASTTIGMSTKNWVNYYLGDDTIHVQTLTFEPVQGIQGALSGDATTASTFITDNSAHNAVYYSTGKDSIRVESVLFESGADVSINGDMAIADTDITLGSSYNAVAYHTGKDAIFVEQAVVSGDATAFFSGDVRDAISTIATDATMNVIKYHLGDDTVKIRNLVLTSGGINDANPQAIVTGDAEAVSSFFTATNTDTMRNNKVAYKMGHDQITLNRIVSDEVDADVQVNGDVGVELNTFINDSSNNKVNYKTGNDSIKIGTIKLNPEESSAFVSGDAITVQPAFSGSSSNNKINYYMGNDKICIRSASSQSVSLVGDMQIATTSLSPSTNNQINYDMGNDILDIGTVVAQDIVTVIGDVNTLQLATGGSNVKNTVTYNTGKDAIYIDAVTLNNVGSQLFIGGDAKMALHSLSGYSEGVVTYRMAKDTIEIGSITSLNDTSLLFLTGDTQEAQNVMFGNSTMNDILFKMGNDDISIGKLTVAENDAAFVVGDAINAESILDSSESNQTHYTMGHDKIFIGKAVGSVVVAGDVATSFSLGAVSGADTNIGASVNETVNFRMGSDWIKVKATLGDAPTIIFGDAGGVPEGTMDLNPTNISVAGTGNVVFYKDGSDTIKAGKGSQTVVADTIYQINVAVDNEVIVKRGDDWIDLGKDKHQDIAMFQVLELTNAHGQPIGPGHDVVKHFDPSDNDLLRFVIFDTDDADADTTAQDLEALITNFSVNAKRTLVTFEDGSTIKLVGNFLNAWDNENQFVNSTLVQVFDIDDPIPLS